MSFFRKGDAKKIVPRISDTEWEVLRVIWRKHPITAAEVVDTLAALDSSWHPKTVRTLLARLVRKQALGYEASGRTYVYRPLICEQESIATASESFLDRVLGGSIRPMLAHFVEMQKLTKDDLEALNNLLEDKPNERRRNSGKEHGNSSRK